MAYETRQKKKSQFTTDNAVTNDSLFDFVKSGVNKKASWSDLLDLIASVFGLSMRVFDTQSELVASNIRIGEHAIVVGNRYALYSIGSLDAGNGDVTLTSGYVATQITKLNPYKIETYDDWDDIDTSILMDNEPIEIVGTESNKGIAGQSIAYYEAGHTKVTNDGTIWKLDSNWYTERVTENSTILATWKEGIEDAGAGFTFNSRDALFALRVETNSILIPKTTNGILVDVDNNFTGIDQEYKGEGSIRNPHLISKSTFGAGKHVLGISGTVTLGNLHLKGSVDTTIDLDEEFPSASGFGLSIKGSANKQWSSVRDMFIQGYNVGVNHDSAYYQEYSNLNCHDNNIGFWLNQATDGAVGSCPIYGGHFRVNHQYGMLLDGNNDFHCSDTVFEYNRTHILQNSGSARFSGCYLGDGPFQIANVTGGLLILDQQGVSSLGSGGNIEGFGGTPYVDTASIDKKVDYHCGGVEATGSGTVVEIHNAILSKNVYSNYGVSGGTRDNGSDLRFTSGAICRFYNTKVETYFPVSYDSDAGSLRRGDIMNNYFVNGLFDRPETVAYDIGGAASATIATPEENPFAKHKAEITLSGNFTYACRFSVPERFVGKTMAMCLLIGAQSGSVSNRTMGKIGFTVTDNFSETSSSFWADGGLNAVSMGWYKVSISATEGAVQLNGTVTGSNQCDLYGFILTEEENYQKLGNYQDAWVRRMANSAPSVGTWRLRDEFIDENATAGASKFVCTVAGTPGTWIATG